MTEKTWIETQAISEDDRAVLVRENLKTPESLHGLTVADLKAAGVSLGGAGAVLRAAGVLRPAADQPVAAQEIRVRIDEPTAADELRRSLGELNAKGTRSGAITKLRALGVSRAVVDGAGSVVEDATLEYLEEGAPAVDWWGDLEVRDIDKVGKAALHHPRTGQRVTKADPVGWHALGRDDLVVAAAIYIEGLDAGDSERTVLADVQARGPIAARAAKRLAANQALRRAAEARVDGEDRQAAPAGGGRSPRGDAPPRGGSRGGSMTPIARLEEFLCSGFRAEELRRFLGRLPAGREIVDALPGGAVSLSELVHQAVGLLRRTGQIDHGLKMAMRAELPRRADEIDRVFEAFGV